MNITWERPKYLEDLISDEDKKRWQIITKTPIIHTPLTMANYREVALREITALNQRTSTSRELLLAITEYDTNQREIRRLVKEKKDSNKSSIDTIARTLDKLRTQIGDLVEQSGTVNVQNDDKKIRSFMDSVNVKTVHEQIENMRILTDWAIQQGKRIEFVKETAVS
jgi:methanogenic corrinoid protein MtbC1